MKIAIKRAIYDKYGEDKLKEGFFSEGSKRAYLYSESVIIKRIYK